MLNRNKAQINININICHQCSAVFGLMQITKCPIFITYSSTPLTDHILGRLFAKILQESIKDLGLLYHQLTYCIGKISKIKIGGVHKTVEFCSRKNYAVDALKDSPRKIKFLINEYPENVSWTFSDFFQEVMTIIDSVGLCKTKRLR